MPRRPQDLRRRSRHCLVFQVTIYLLLGTAYFEDEEATQAEVDGCHDVQDNVAESDDAVEAVEEVKDDSTNRGGEDLRENHSLGNITTSGRVLSTRVLASV